MRETKSEREKLRKGDKVGAVREKESEREREAGFSFPRLFLNRHGQVHKMALGTSNTTVVGSNPRSFVCSNFNVQ